MSAFGQVGAPRIEEREESDLRSIALLAANLRGTTYEELALRFGISTMTVYRRLKRARLKIGETKHRQVRRCSNCRKTGHYSPSCKSEKRAEPASVWEGPIQRHFCSGCGKHGHNIRTCKKKNES